MNETCMFKSRYGDDCDINIRCSTNCGPSRIQTIINASKTYKDGLCLELEKQFALNPNVTVQYHKNCVSRYTSKTNLVKYRTDNVAAAADDDDGPSTKRLRHSCQLFDFMQHCLYCGDSCDINKDEKHPSRWRPAYMCRSTHSEHDRQPYKEYLIGKCDSRGDKWANEVRLRIQGALSDLHAVEARYHKDCMSRFFGHKNLTNDADDAPTAEDITDSALHAVIETLCADKSRIWNSVELFQEYTSNSGYILSRASLVQELRHHFRGEVLVLSSPGIASIVTFESNTAQTLRIVKDDDEDDIVRYISKVGKQVAKECKAIDCDKKSYNIHINKHTAAESVSSTLQDLLITVSPKFDQSLPALLIGNIITSVVNNAPTDLQIALGVLMRDSKALLSHMYEYRVTCSYDEILRFKKSAAVATAKDLSEQGLSDAKYGMVQVAADNFDADISSPNGKSSTHCLAMIIMQPECGTETHADDTITRLKKEEISQPILEENDNQIPVYYGQKKPVMPCVPVESLPKDFKKHQDVSWRRANENDFVFFHDILTCTECPEFNGYNTKLCREQGHTVKSKTKIVYLPLIDMPPADPSTMMSAMVKSQQISQEVGQEYAIFTADQQLYRIALHIKWENPVHLGNVYLRLGGMHLLMSYCGCVGTLMADTGIVDVLSAVFGGVLKMLSGKKYPQNVRALRMLVEELLRSVFVKYELKSMSDLLEKLDDLASKSRTAKLWVDCLIKPIFTILKYIRAEREADWALHLEIVEEMIPLFFAAGHVNYARYALYYLRSMQDLPHHIQTQFLKGQHTMHHNAGLFNGIWSDMAIETTFMRYGHSKGGIVGITLKPETLKTWAYSLHTCQEVLNNLNEMRDSTEGPSSQTHHKEEMAARIQVDKEDRNKLLEKLELCIDPLDAEQHSNGLVNIVTGQVVAHSSVNVDKAIKMGKDQMESFEKSWPDGFHDTISKTVTTMAVTRKHIKVGDTKVFDPEIIYARAMGLQSSARDLDTGALMSHELSPVPTSMFDEKGNMRDAKTKSNLKNSLKVEMSRRLAERDVQATFLDGCAVLWVVPWPSSGTVQDYLDRFRNYVQKHLAKSDVYLVFDRYIEGSTKETTRHGRDKSASRVYTLRCSARLPPQKVILTVTTNKAQLIDLIVEDLMSHKDDFKRHKLVVTGSDPIPVEITWGHVTKRQDMTTTQEEGDTLIVQQVARIAAGTVMVIADDTDIFILLMHFCHQGNIPCRVLMVSPIQGRAILDINATVEKHSAIVPDLLAAHGLTGCDTVASYFGIGKGVALKVLRSGKCKLDLLGNTDPDVSFSAVVEQATQFMLACYGQSSCQSLTDARKNVWSLKVGRSKASAPKLAALPPTNEAFRENVARAHLQVAVWLHALAQSPPGLDATAYGWSLQEHGSKALSPNTVPADTLLVPPELMKLIKCSCESDTPCKTQRCSCNSSKIACTIFCSCNGGNVCQNEKSLEVLRLEDEED